MCVLCVCGLQVVEWESSCQREGELLVLEPPLLVTLSHSASLSRPLTLSLALSPGKPPPLSITLVCGCNELYLCFLRVLRGCSAPLPGPSAGLLGHSVAHWPPSHSLTPASANHVPGGEAPTGLWDPPPPTHTGPVLSRKALLYNDCVGVKKKPWPIPLDYVQLISPTQDYLVRFPRDNKLRSISILSLPLQTLCLSLLRALFA